MSMKAMCVCVISMIVSLRRSSEKLLHNTWFMKVHNGVIIVGPERDRSRTAQRSRGCVLE
jgi:hypothetical protein